MTGTLNLSSNVVYLDPSQAGTWSFKINVFLAIGMQT